MKKYLPINKICLFALICALTSFSLNAQKMHFLFSYNPVIPVSFLQNANIGIISGNAGFDFNIGKKLYWISTVGYNKFGAKTTTIQGTESEYESNFTFIPVTTGLQYFFKEAGATRYAYREKGTRYFTILKAGYFFPSGDLVKGDIGVSAGGGVQIASKSGKSKFDISLFYNDVLGAKTKVFKIGSLNQATTFHNLSYIGINLGLVFGL